MRGININNKYWIVNKISLDENKKFKQMMIS